MDKPKTTSLIENLIDQSKEYVDTKIELLKLKTIEKASYVFSYILITLLFGIFFFLFFVVLNIGLALFIGDLLGKAYWGFFIMAGVYIIAGLIIFFTRNKIFKGPITAMFIRKFL